jgi:cytochrome P450
VVNEIRGFDAVRQAAKDFQRYSSELQGDRDTRDYRQLPLEADPPRHTLLREAVQPYFLASYIESLVPQFEALLENLITEIREKGHGDINLDLSIPYVMGCLTIIYNRPQDYDRWVSWGPDVWTAQAFMDYRSKTTQHNPDAGALPTYQSNRSGEVLQKYLDEVFDYAEANPNNDPKTQDIWDFVSQLEINGQRVSRKEMQGIANLLLAGGRGTVIDLINGLIWHLMTTPADRDFLAQNPHWFNRTIAEVVRYLSPLPKMERVLTEDVEIPDADRDTSKYVHLSFISANYDRDFWPDADKIDIYRERKPNLAFGFGRHSCMGMNITEQEVGALLRIILKNWPNWEFAKEPKILWSSALDKNGDEIRHIDKFVEFPVLVKK